MSADKPFDNLYYTVELPGVYKYIALTSYAPNQTFSHQEEQYTWLEQELSKVSDPISLSRLPCREPHVGCMRSIGK